MFDQICVVRSTDKKSRGCLIVNSISELAVKNTDLGVALLGIQAKRKENIVNLIKQAATQNELPKDTDVETMANVMFAFMSGLSAFSKTGANKQKLYSMCHVFLRQMGFNEQ
jgi:TetR/AcrR family transcriptional repressor of nem operon